MLLQYCSIISVMKPSNGDMVWSPMPLKQPRKILALLLYIASSLSSLSVFFIFYPYLPSLISQIHMLPLLSGMLGYLYIIILQLCSLLNFFVLIIFHMSLEGNLMLFLTAGQIPFSCHSLVVILVF
jgi:hypothetical protein